MVAPLRAELRRACNWSSEEENVSILKLPFGVAVTSVGFGLQSVERRDLAGNRAQGSDLDVAFFGDLFQAGITVL